MPVFVLGPTYWRQGYVPDIPPWIGSYLPSDWKAYGGPRLEPVDLRAALCGWLARWGVSATIMRMHEDREGEATIEKFRRVERDLGITQHFVYYPYGARGEGHVGEIVALLDRRAAGQDVDVRVFPESRVVDKSDGEFHVLEEGRGSGYMNDLIQMGCPVPEWDDHTGLFRAFRWHADP